MTRSRFPVWPVLLVLVTIAVYWPAMRCGFVNFADDDLYVTSNVHVQNGLTFESLKWAFFKPEVYFGYWHPLTVLTHMVDCQLFGLNPWGHHLTNVLLHAVNAALVFALLQQLTGATWRSLLVAALFAVHPLRVESVAWVAERKDVLSACFGLLALLFYARYAQGRLRVGPEINAKPVQAGPAKRRKDASREQPRIERGIFGAGTSRRSATNRADSTDSDEQLLPVQSVANHPALCYGLALFFFACGLMSKPMLVTWPFVMLLLDYWPLSRFQPLPLAPCSPSPVPSVKSVPFVARNPGFWRLMVEKIPFFALATAASVVTFVVQQQKGILMPVEDLPLGARVGNALISYCRYLGKLFWPADLAVFYPHPGYWPMAKVLLAGGLLLGISVLFIVERRRYPFLLMGWLWYCGTLVPVIQLVQVAVQAMADRYTYIPTLGMLIVVIWGAHELAKPWRYHTVVLSVASSAAIVLCIMLTRQQIGYWKDAVTLFRHALEVTENNCRAYLNFGTALLNNGQTDEAIIQFQEAIRRRPDYAEAHYNLGNAFVRKGQTDEAIYQFQEAIRLKPDYVDAHNNLGAALGRKGEIDEAIRQFREVVFLEPDGAEGHNALGIALDKKGEMDEAIRQYQEAIRLKPDYAAAHSNLGAALFKKGEMDEAILQYQEATRLKPDYAEAHHNLGIALDKKGRIDEAIIQYQEAIRLKPDYAEAHDNLGNACFNKGQIDAAIIQYREAIRLKPDYAEAHNNLGTAFFKKGQIDEAIIQYQEGIRLNPDGAEAHFNLGTALVNKGRLDEAILQYQEAIRLKPDYADAYYNLGIVLGMKGQTDEAIRQFREALRLRPDDAVARKNLGIALGRKGQTDGSIK